MCKLEKRKKFPFLLFLFLLCTGFPVFAGGKPEAAEEAVAHNNEWTMYITDFDVSSLSSSRQPLGRTITQTLVESLNFIDHRIRSQQETEYYRDIIWSKSRSDAAKALAAKQNERDLVVFRGDPSWRYESTLKTFEADISKLEAQLRTAEITAPVISQNPEIKIANPLGPWPAQPAEGDEYRFCVNQRADAFLSGKVTEFYDRIYVTLKLYTIHTGSYSWEDSILFSPDDLDNALSELGNRLNAVISGMEPAAIIVHAEPEDAMIIIDDFMAGRGEIPLMEHVPGIVNTTVHAENYISANVPLELNSGEITEVFFNLTPLSLSTLTFDVPDSPGSSVYYGGLFLGMTPLAVELNTDRLSYFSVQTPSGETGAAVFNPNGNIRGNAEFISSDNAYVFSTTMPLFPEQKPIAAARDKFYSAWGRFWIALPLSFVAIGFANNHINAYNYNKRMYDSYPNIYPYPSSDLYNSMQTANYIRYGAFTVIGLALADTVYNIVRYLIVSGSDANPVARTTNQNTEYSE